MFKMHILSDIKMLKCALRHNNNFSVDSWKDICVGNVLEIVP